MSRAPYAPSYRFQDGEQTAYNTGLSYFPDAPYMVNTPMGDIVTDLASLTGTAAGGPAGGVAAGAASSVIQKWFGGSAVDAQRQDRVNYVAQAAVNGNVAAMQLVLGAPNNVSGNEKQMWQTAYTLIKQANPGVVAAAEALGPQWLVNSGDTATNYPRMRSLIAAWAAQNPIATAKGAVTSALSSFFNPTPVPTTPVLGPTGLPMLPAPAAHINLMPILVLGGAVAAAFVLMPRRRGR